MNKNEKTLKAFTEYCVQNPNQRFFQAATNFFGLPFLGWVEDHKTAGFHDLWHEEALDTPEKEGDNK